MAGSLRNDCTPLLYINASTRVAAFPGAPLPIRVRFFTFFSRWAPWMPGWPPVPCRPSGDAMQGTLRLVTSPDAREALEREMRPRTALLGSFLVGSHRQQALDSAPLHAELV